jgi:hypothetical protein
MVRRKAAIVELVYPCKCGCGRRGHFVIGLHILLLGYLLAQVALIKASGRRSKSTMMIYPRSSDLVQQLFGEFDRVVAEYAEVVGAKPTDSDRTRLDLSAEEWQAFLRRMGFPGDDGEKRGE